MKWSGYWKPGPQILRQRSNWRYAPNQLQTNSVGAVTDVIPIDGVARFLCVSASLWLTKSVDGLGEDHADVGEGEVGFGGPVVEHGLDLALFAFAFAVAGIGAPLV